MCPASLIDQSSGIFTTATLSTPVRRDTCAVVDNVRAALGIGESVYNERPVPLALFGNYNDGGGAVFSSGLAARVMPRHLAEESEAWHGDLPG